MIYSAAHKVVVYDVPNPAAVIASIAGTKQVSPTQVAVPATLFSMQLARIIGLPVPAVMDIAGYTWPIQPGNKPFPQQIVSANFKVLHPRAFDLSEMRTGKTLSSLWAADFLMAARIIKKGVIMSPLSTLERVWGNSLFRNFLGRRTYTILHGDEDVRLSRLDKDVDFYIINHDGIKVGCKKTQKQIILGPLAEALQQRDDINLFIVDEVGAFRNSSSLRSKVLQRIVDSKPYLWSLTGTPTPRAPTDAYGLGKLHKTTSESFQSFRGRTMLQISPFKWIPRASAPDIVSRTLTPSIRFSRAECIALPPAEFETRDVEMSTAQAKAYQDLKKDLSMITAGGKQITVANEAALRIKLLQIACGAIYGQNREIVYVDAAPRLKAVADIIDEAGSKILVFAPFTSVVNFVSFELRKLYGEDAVAKVYGDTTAAQRNHIFRRFEEDPVLRTLVADPRTMAHGLDLSTASTIIWFAPFDDAEIYEQANVRIDGINQKHGMYVVRLASSPVEREIYRRLAEKLSLQGAVLKLAEEDR